MVDASRYTLPLNSPSAAARAPTLSPEAAANDRASSCHAAGAADSPLDIASAIRSK